MNKEELLKLSDYVLELSDIIQKNPNIPVDILQCICKIFDQVTILFKECSDEMKNVSVYIIEQSVAIEELCSIIADLKKENEELKIIADAAQKFPGFQC